MLSIHCSSFNNDFLEPLRFDGSNEYDIAKPPNFAIIISITSFLDTTFSQLLTNPKILTRSNFCMVVLKFFEECDIHWIIVTTHSDNIIHLVLCKHTMRLYHKIAIQEGSPIHLRAWKAMYHLYLSFSSNHSSLSPPRSVVNMAYQTRQLLLYYNMTYIF